MPQYTDATVVGLQLYQRPLGEATFIGFHHLVASIVEIEGTGLLFTTMAGVALHADLHSPELSQEKACPLAIRFAPGAFNEHQCEAPRLSRGFAG